MPDALSSVVHDGSKSYICSVRVHGINKLNRQAQKQPSRKRTGLMKPIIRNGMLIRIEGASTIGSMVTWRIHLSTGSATYSMVFWIIHMSIGSCCPVLKEHRQKHHLCMFWRIGRSHASTIDGTINISRSIIYAFSEESRWAMLALLMVSSRGFRWELSASFTPWSSEESTWTLAAPLTPRLTEEPPVQKRW